MSGGITLWLTGLSGAGKSTLAFALKEKLDEIYKTEYPSFIFDGDVIRKGLCNDLGFSKEDRAENIRRISEVSKLFNMSGQITIVSFISPYGKDRDFARNLHKSAGLKFLEVHVATSLETCEKRDVKGLYKKARSGEIKNFTGISDPYEEPTNPELKIDTNGKTIDECLQILMKSIVDAGHIKDTKCLNISTAPAINDKGLVIEEEEMNWLQVIQQGWAPSSVKCFMNESQLLECLYFKTVTSEGKKSLQSLPMFFPIDSATNTELSKLTGKNVDLLYKGKVVATINNVSTYNFRREEYAAKLFGTISSGHPKVMKYLNKTHLVTGDSFTFPESVSFNDGLDSLRMTPDQISKLAKEKNADCIYAFQLRNPLHNGHCLLLNDTRKQLIERGYKNPVLLLHPCGGWTKDDDVPLSTRVEQHQAIMKNGLLKPESTILAIWPAPMFYAGPLEVLYHFSSRVFAGVDFMIVGRDPAGIKHPEDNSKDLYDPTHGAKILKIASENGLLEKTNVIPFKVAVYNKETKSMEYFDDKRKEMYDFISGSKMRELARTNQPLPEGFMDPEGWKILVAFYQKQ